MGTLRFLRTRDRSTGVWIRNPGAWLAILHVGDFDSRWPDSRSSLLVA